MRPAPSGLVLGRLVWALEQTDPPPGLRVVDQPRQPSEARRLLLGADDIEGGDLAVPRRLRLEEGPRLLVGAELQFVGGVEGTRRPLVRVLLRLLRIAGSERGVPRRLDQPELLQFAEPLDIHGAPVAPRLPRGEPDSVADVVETLADAVDPAEAQDLVERLGVGDAAAAGLLLVEPDQEDGDGVVMLRQPGAQRGGGLEEGWVHALAPAGRFGM